MKRARKKLTRKAASAAFAVIALTATSATPLSPFPVSQEAEETIPPVPDAAKAFNELKRVYHFRQADTPLKIKQFLIDFKGSDYTAEATLMLADWYFLNGEFPLASGYYAEIRDNAFSGDVRETMLYRKAFANIKTGFYDEAAIYFRNLRSSSLYGEDARFYIAYIDYVNGNYDDAYNQFVTIKQSGAKGSEAEYYINQIDYKRGEFEKVANTSERLLAAGKIPDELKAETMRVGGLSFFKLGNKDKARNILSRYVEEAGDGAEISALYSLATIYYDEGDYDKALPLFTIVTDYPGDLAQSAWLYIGQIYISRGDTQAATLAFDKAAKESWNNDVAETAAYNLAVTSAQGMSLPFTDAALAMENFIDTYPSSPYSATMASYLANAYYGKRDYASALRQVNKITNPDATTEAMRQKILYQLGVTQLQQGELDASIRSLSEASSSRLPDKEVGAQASLWLGDALYAKKNYAASAKAYREAIASGKLGHNSALAYYNLGYALQKLANYSEAGKAFGKALSLKELDSRQTADARLRYADCLYYGGNYQDAMSQLRDIKLDGGQDAAYASIREADILGRSGKINERIAILEGVVANPDAGIWRSTALSRLAEAYSEKGDDKKAAEKYAEMIDSNGDSDNSELFYSLATNAENLYNRGEKSSAYSIYKRIEKSGISDLYPVAVGGIMRTSEDAAEIMEYAEKTASLPGLTPDETNEALFIGANAALATSDRNRSDAAVATLEKLAKSSDRYWGARAAVALGENMLNRKDYTGAEKILTYLVDNGSDDDYWLARGYIALADTYSRQDKDYLAKLYLEALRDNYPGQEKDIREMINSRLKALDK